MYIFIRVKLVLIVIGKTQKGYLSEAVVDFSERIKHYMPFEIIMIPTIKKSQKIASKNEILQAEESAMMKYIRDDDYLIILDERGKSFRSVEFADYLQKVFLTGNKRMVFVIGGAWGIGGSLKKKANVQLSVSKMTFSHQLVRLIFLEQLYRALTILRNEPYHNE